MKKTLLILVLSLTSAITFAQKESGFGIKAGLNYAQNGDLTLESIGNAGEDVIDGSESKIGYHLGVFYKLKLPIIYLRPELIYTKTKSNYTINGSDAAYDVSKIDLPVLVGVKIIGPLEVFAGPSFQYILDSDLEKVPTLNDLENDFSLGLQIGVGVSLGKLGLDVRYERGLSENESKFVADNSNTLSGRVDSRPSQIIFGLSLKL